MYKLFDLNWFFEGMYLIIIDKKNLSSGSPSKIILLSNNLG